MKNLFDEKTDGINVYAFFLLYMLALCGPHLMYFFNDFSFPFVWVPELYSPLEVIHFFWGGEAPSKALVEFLNLILILSLSGSILIRKYRRHFLLLSAVAFLLVEGFYFGFDRFHRLEAGHVDRTNNLVLPVLLTFLFYGDLSILNGTHSKVKAWPITLVKLHLGLFYFANFYAKISASQHWWKGDVLQSVAMAKYLSSPTDLLLHLAQSHYLCKIAACTVLFWEGTFIFGVFFKRATPFYFLFGVAFHITAYLIFGFNFLRPQFFFCYLAFVDWVWLREAISTRFGVFRNFLNSINLVANPTDRNPSRRS